MQREVGLSVDSSTTNLPGTKIGHKVQTRLANGVDHENAWDSQMRRALGPLTEAAVIGTRCFPVVERGQCKVVVRCYLQSVPHAVSVIMRTVAGSTKTAATRLCQAHNGHILFPRSTGLQIEYCEDAAALPATQRGTWRVSRHCLICNRDTVPS